ncbi:Flp family type IVb pilin [Bacillus salipaludis]|uniref:Flp family type IVb pilin n=1 Tax=Bacillus salipaludis TaxID=2547811 RepID=UPI002E1F51BB|nr:Flp family type IVb pilin [Bacillus salipaludis]
MLKKIKNLVVQEEGQALTEYGLIIGLIAVGCITLLATMGEKIAGWFTEITTAIEDK